MSATNPQGLAFDRSTKLASAKKHSTYIEECKGVFAVAGSFHTHTHKRHMDSYLLLDVEASALPHSLEFNPVTSHFAAEPGSLLHAVDEIPSC